MPYKLNLTEADLETVDFVGGRYNWSIALQRAYRQCETETGYDEGALLVPEHVAWEIVEAFEADTEGGHSPFPMLDPRSELYKKLNRFWEGVV